jgi:hypothetical protein
MNLEITKQIINGKINKKDPMGSLIHVFEAVIELVSLPDNDFSWSSWEGAEEAITEVKNLISSVQKGRLPDRVKVSVIFAPTGPLQEVSLSSGWGKAFLKLAEKYDELEKLLWKIG